VIREPTLRYDGERARGGAGLLITENTSACYPRGANSAHEIGVSDDSFLPGLTALCEVVHKHGAKIAIQLAHHGKIARLDTHQGRELLMPSVPRGHAGIGAPLDLTAEEMGLMAKAFGGAKPKVHEATVQDLEKFGTPIYCGVRNHELDRAGGSFDDVLTALAGARVKF